MIGNLVKCTGRRMASKLYFSTSQNGHLTSIMKNTITMNEQNYPMVSNFNNTSTEFVSSIVLLESIREGYWSRYNIENVLDRLEKSAKEYKLSPREQYYAAAGLAWANNDYKLAAVLLESIVYTNSDPYALSLAQEAYILAGSNENALGCIIRHPIAMNLPQELAPSIHGMISLGFLETGRLHEAKEAAQRGIAMADGKDSKPVRSLLEYFYMSGKSSELVSTVDEHINHFQHTGKIPFLALNGSAYIMRGNCNGGYKACSEILTPTIVTEALSDEPYAQSTLTYASFLLWHLILHIDYRHKIPLDNILQPLQQGMQTTMSSAAVLYLLKAMQLAVSARSIQTLNRNDLLDLKPTDLHGKRGLFGNKKVRKTDSGTGSWSSWFGGEETTQTPAAATTTPQQVIKEDDVEAIAVRHLHETNPVLQQHTQEIKDLLIAYIAELDELLLEEDKKKNDNAAMMSAKYPTLSAIPVVPTLSFLYQPIQDQQLQSQTYLATLQVSKAIAYFGLEQYDECIALLTPQHHNQYKRLGISSFHRDILHQTLIEAYIRKHDLQTASVLLSERTILLPNDGQAWKRLSKIYTELGQAQLAGEAQYTAWQLGIGQGGFGGPI